MRAEPTTIEYLDEHDHHVTALARAIWELPEVALQERFASRLIGDELASNGFTVEWGIGGMDTAFMASWGDGGPLVGVLGVRRAARPLAGRHARAPGGRARRTRARLRPTTSTASAHSPPCSACRPP
jgi:hypothetical protein